MPLVGEYEPSTWPPSREQVELYEHSGGAEGNTLEGFPVVILTMLGRASGKLRETPVMRVHHDGCYALVASMGGAPVNPAWYHNVRASP